MIDLLSAVQQAVFTRLKSASDASSVPTFSAVPQDTQPPYRVIADIDSDSEADKGGGQFEYIQIEVHTVYRGTSRAALLASMHATRLALDGQPLVADGAHFEAARFVKASASRAGPDGVTYVGVSLFETFGQPA